MSSLWESLKEEQDILTRIYFTNNFFGIVADTLSDLVNTASKDPHKIDLEVFLEIFANSLKTVGKSNLWFKTSYDLANTILFGFFKILRILHSISAIHTKAVDLFTQQISDLLKASLLGNSDISKLSTAFNDKSLTTAFVTLGFDLSPLVREYIKTVLSTLLLNEKSKDNEIYLKDINSENELIKSEPEEVISNAVEEFYTLIAVYAPKKAPDAFSKLSEQFPFSISRILKASGNNQIKIKTDALSKVVEKALQDSKKIEWDFLESIVDIDASILTESECLTKLFTTKSSATSSFLQFARSLVKYFAEARELVQFILTWKMHISSKSPWCADEVIEAISSEVKSLSTHQLKGLLTTLVRSLNSKSLEESAAQVFTPISVILMSFISNNVKIPSILAEQLDSVLNSDSFKDSEHSWRGKFLILSLNSNFVQNHSEKILKQLKSIKFGAEKDSSDNLCFYSMQTYFRIREFLEIDEFNKIVTKYLKFIKKRANDSSKFLNNINNRWLLVANYCFNFENQSALIDLFSQNEALFHNLCLNDVFYEQRNLSKIVMTQVAAEISNSKTISVQRSEFLSYMPIEIVKRDNRSLILSGLVAKSSNIKDLDLQIKIRIAVEKLLQRPTLVTDIETKPDVLRNYFLEITETHDPELYDATISSCESVIEYHSQLMKTEERSESFINTILKAEVKFLKSLDTSVSLSLRDFARLDFAVLVAITVQKEIVESSTLSSRLISILLHQLELSKGNISHNLTQSITIIRNLDKLSELLDDVKSASTLKSVLGEYVVYSMKCLQNGVEISKSTELLIHTFHVLIRSASDATELEILIALHAILCMYEVKVNKNIVIAKLSQLDDSVFFSLLESLVTVSFEGSLPPFAYFNTISLFAISAEHETHKSSISSFIKLVNLAQKNAQTLDKKSLLSFLGVVQYIVKSKTWLVTQYYMELIFSTVTKLATKGPSITLVESQDDVYKAITTLFSTILLHHRMRLPGRFFLVTKIFTVLLSTLALPSASTFNPRFIISNEESGSFNSLLSNNAAIAYARLLENLCEPHTRTIREVTGKSNLNSLTAEAKRQVSKFIGVLLVNYIRITLQTGFDGPIKKTLTQAFYTVFDLLDDDKMKNVNFMLDSDSRPYFKTLYDDYLAHGKWKKD